MPISLKKELKILAVREGTTIKDILNKQTAEYVKIHKDGNPQHLMTNFLENENFGGFASLAVDYKRKKDYISKNLQKDGKLNKLGQEAWGHICQWHQELQKL